MRKIDLDFALWPHQRELFDRFVVEPGRATKFFLIGGVQDGKTYGGARCFYGRVLTTPGDGKGRVWWCVAPTYKLGAKQERELREVCKGMTRRFYETDRILVLKTGDELWFRTADDPQQLRMESCSGIWWDEAGLCSEEVYLILLERLLAMDGPLLATTTPKSSMSPWLHEEWEKHGEDPRYYWRFAMTEDNKALKPERVAELRARFPDEFGEEELDGKFIRSKEGLVYGKVWEPKVHLVRENYKVDPAVDTIWSSTDAGVANPCVTTWYAERKQEKSGLIVTTAFRELYERGVAPSEYVRLMKQEGLEELIDRTGGARWVDPSAAGLRMEMMTQGLKTRAAKNDRMEGVQACYALLKERLPDGLATFRVVRGACPNFCREIGLYRYPKKSDHKNPSEDPLKLEDHVMDEWRYFVLSRKRPHQVIGITTAAKIVEEARAVNRPTVTVMDGKPVIVRPQVRGVDPRKRLEAERVWHRGARAFLN